MRGNLTSLQALGTTTIAAAAAAAAAEVAEHLPCKNIARITGSSISTGGV